MLPHAMGASQRMKTHYSTSTILVFERYKKGNDTLDNTTTPRYNPKCKLDPLTPIIQ
jgi:hypothetical protein